MISNITRQEEVDTFRELFFTRLDALQQELNLLSRLIKGVSTADLSILVVKWFHEVSADAAIEAGVNREEFLAVMGDVFDELMSEREASPEETEEEEGGEGEETIDS